MSERDWQETSWLYGFQCGPWTKIGITRDMGIRLEQVRLFNPYSIKIVLRRQVLSRHARRIEMCVHQFLAPYAAGREWFFAAPIEEIRQYAVAAIRAAQEVEREELADYDEAEDAPPPVDSAVEI